MCATEAPASKASWVDSICSLGVIGTAGVSALRGMAPVIATVMIAGVVMSYCCRSADEMEGADARPQRNLLYQRNERGRCQRIINFDRSSSLKRLVLAVGIE